MSSEKFAFGKNREQERRSSQRGAENGTSRISMIRVDGKVVMVDALAEKMGTTHSKILSCRASLMRRGDEVTETGIREWLASRRHLRR